MLLKHCISCIVDVFLKIGVCFKLREVAVIYISVLLALH